MIICYSSLRKLIQELPWVARWIRICLPMHGTWVRSLTQEDPTCWGTTKPVHHHYRTCALESMLHKKRSHFKEKPTLHNEEELPLGATARENPVYSPVHRSSNKDPANLKIK